MRRSNERIPASTCATRHARLRRGQAAGERRVRVAVDEHDVGPLLGEQRLERLEHARGLRRVRPAVDAQLDLRAAGSRAPRRRPSTARRRGAGRCGRATSSCSARSGRDTAAALTNCGRFPMTVRTFRTATPRSARAALAPPRASRGPPRSQLVVLDRVHGLDLARRRGEERLGHPRAGRRRGVTRSCAPVSSSTRRRVIESRMWSLERRRAQLAVEHVEERRGRRPRARGRAAWRAAPRRSRAPARAASASMFARVGERLDPVEHAASARTRRGRARPTARRLGQRLDQRDPAAAARDEDADAARRPARAASSSASTSAAHRVDVERQPQPLGAAAPCARGARRARTGAPP